MVKGREGETDEGRTAAGGCHGNREDCYTAHVNRRECLMGGGVIGGFCGKLSMSTGNKPQFAKYSLNRDRVSFKVAACTCRREYDGRHTHTQLD